MKNNVFVITESYSYKPEDCYDPDVENFYYNWFLDVKNTQEEAFQVISERREKIGIKKEEQVLITEDEKGILHVKARDYDWIILCKSL